MGSKAHLVLYPINKKVGVPNNNNPTPKIDWNTQNKAIKIISTVFIKKFLILNDVLLPDVLEYWR